MYKVIIVDDEDLIRKGLKTFIDWNNLGFQLVGEALNGNEAFDLINRFSPDVVLTDIKMPVLNGIELMKKMRENGINSKIIVLSGHDEFEYAKAALEAGAIDYLLKPVKLDKLKEILERVKVEFDKEKIENIKKKESQKLLGEQFLLNLANGRINSSEDICKQSSSLNMCFNYKYYTIIIVEIDNFTKLSSELNESNIEVMISSLRNIVEECGNSLGQVYTFIISGKEIGILLGTDSCTLNCLKLLAKNIQTSIYNSSNMETTIGIGYTGEKLSEVHIFYKSAKEALSKKFYLGKNKIISYEDKITRYPSVTGIHDDNTENKLMLLLKNYDVDAINEMIEYTFMNIYNKNMIYEKFLEIVKLVSKFLNKAGKNISEIIDESFLSVERIMHRETIYDIIDDLKEIILKSLDYLESVKYKNINTILQFLTDYISKHHSEDISLEKAAKIVYMHPIYLSRLFKKEIGMSYTDYLTNIRVDNAKKLMADPSIKIYEISQKIGYASPKHFSHIFKKTTGITPKEYRTSILEYDLKE